MVRHALGFVFFFEWSPRGRDFPPKFSFEIWIKSQKSLQGEGYSREGGLHGKGLSKTNTPGVSISTEAMRHTLTPEDNIDDAGSREAAKARALAVKDDDIPVFPNVPAAEGGEGRGRWPSDHAGECMQLVHLQRRTRGCADGLPEVLSKGASKDDVGGALGFVFNTRFVVRRL
jgi:hypothetical protein